MPYQPQNSESREALQVLTRSAYNSQQIRIAISNRVFASFKAKKDRLDPEGRFKDDDILRKVKHDYAKITDGRKVFPRRKHFKPEGWIRTYADLILVHNYEQMRTAEEEQFKRIEDLLPEFPIYEHFLKQVSGCGRAMSAVIISEFDIHKAKYVSNLWSYAGLDVAHDGRARSKRQEHLIEREYQTKDGQTKKRNSITFNNDLRAKLMGGLAPSLMRSGGHYSKIYREYRNRIDNSPKWEGTSLGHRHMASLRYMVKMLLKDLYPVWRELEGLPVAVPYDQAVLGRHAHGQWPNTNSQPADGSGQVGVQ